MHRTGRRARRWLAVFSGRFGNVCSRFLCWFRLLAARTPLGLGGCFFGCGCGRRIPCQVRRVRTGFFCGIVCGLIGASLFGSTFTAITPAPTAAAPAPTLLARPAFLIGVAVAGVTFGRRFLRLVVVIGRIIAVPGSSAIVIRAAVLAAPTAATLLAPAIAIAIAPVFLGGVFFLVVEVVFRQILLIVLDQDRVEPRGLSRARTGAGHVHLGTFLLPFWHHFDGHTVTVFDLDQIIALGIEQIDGSFGRGIERDNAALALGGFVFDQADAEGWSNLAEGADALDAFFPAVRSL